MAADFSIKAHDLAPPIQAVLTIGGEPVDLTTATGVKFIMKATAGGALTVNAAAVIVAPPTSGTVRYDWTGTDTAIAGTYQGEWEITWPGPKKQSAPTTSYHSIEILADLDNA